MCYLRCWSLLKLPPRASFRGHRLPFLLPRKFRSRHRARLAVRCCHRWLEAGSPIEITGDATSQTVDCLHVCPVPADDSLFHGLAAICCIRPHRPIDSSISCYVVRVCSHAVADVPWQEGASCFVGAIGILALANFVPRLDKSISLKLPGVLDLNTANCPTKRR